MENSLRQALPHLIHGNNCHMDEKVAKWLFIGILCLLTGVRFYYKIRYYRLVTVKAFAYESKWLVVFRYVLGIGLLVDRKSVV